MAKLAIILAMLTLLAALQATMASTVVEDEEQSRQHRCQEQIARQGNVQNCQRYLSLGHQSQLESLNQCCTELGNIHEQCRCQAVNYIFRKQHGQGELEGLQRRAAENLSSRCNLSPQQCQIEAILA